MLSYVPFPDRRHADPGYDMIISVGSGKPRLLMVQVKTMSYAIEYKAVKSAIDTCEARLRELEQVDTYLDTLLAGALDEQRFASLYAAELLHWLWVRSSIKT